MSESFNMSDDHSNFDFKGFLMKLVSYWPFFLFTFAISFGIAYYINVRKLPVYSLKSMVSIKEDQNPFFTNNTSLTFNWGGTTDKVNTAVVTLKSRSHNEKVIERLQYYLIYLREGKYQQVDAYRQSPYFLDIDTTHFQIINRQFIISFKDSITFNLSTNLNEGGHAFQRYDSKEKITKYVGEFNFSKDYKFGEKIETPYFAFSLVPNRHVSVRPGKKYFVTFSDFDNTVKNFSRVIVKPIKDGSSILTLKIDGFNKKRIVDYLNSSVQVLSEDMLRRKNLFATKTIRFIDSTLRDKSKELLSVEDELNDYKNKNEIFNLQNEGQEIIKKLNALDLRKEGIDRQLNYYEGLEYYLLNRTDYRDVPAPSVDGISEQSIVAGVGRIITLAEDRIKLEYSYKDGAPIFKDIDRQIDAVKDVLLENINSSKGLIRQELSSINRDIAKFEGEIKRLPKEQQDLLKIERRYLLSQSSYNLFLAKRSEASLVKAANVSDVQIIDEAKDTGGGRIGPNTQVNYIIAGMFGALIPLIFVFLKAFFDTRIVSIKEIERLTTIPVLGVIRRTQLDNNLAVLLKPKSAISESFRSLRSSLQFMYKEQGVTGAKSVLITSSVSGEGKTFCSINIASVFALSEKKTILVGLDLRKPKIFGDFDIDNDIGVVNYLIHEADIPQIIQKTREKNLDVITSGPIPPNPSELLMGDRMSTLITELKKDYDYIVLDSPPLGLVSDALSLTKFVDTTIYLTRQNYTKRGMFTVINDKYKSGEISNISIVLNFFEGKARYGYGYDYGYGYGYGTYGKGYHDKEEKSNILTWIKKIFKKKK